MSISNIVYYSVRKSINSNQPIIDVLKQAKFIIIRSWHFQGGSEQNRRGLGDEERLYKARGPKYARVPSRPTLSTSTTCTSLATTCGSQGTLVPNYDPIPENVTTESSSEDEQDSFEKTRRHFQQLRQISLGNEFKYKMEMEIKSAKEENLRNSIPFVKQLSSEGSKVLTDYAINGDIPPYAPTTKKIFFWTQVR